jgi:formylglycine-generating enzyme required for sulfatase activity
VVELSDDERAFLGPTDPRAMLAELERPDTNHRQRALIGERLDVLGDPRLGVGVDGNGTPRIDWRVVDGGEVHLKGVGLPPRLVDGFQVARYPITLAQYRAFLEAEDGWRDLASWAPDLYRDPEGDSIDVGRFDNYPVVYVNWFDAMAFSRWLSRRLDVTVSLPDEWQWQQAATGGTPSSTYPWGDEWDPKREPHRANTFESRLCGSTAVGMYPAGASPTKALDMAGTVWNWCLNKYERPDVTVSWTDDFDPRVLRGGSWYEFWDDARCADRLGYFPLDRSLTIGFRVVCSSPAD